MATLCINTNILMELCSKVLFNMSMNHAYLVTKFYDDVRLITNSFGRYAFPISEFPNNDSIDKFFDDYCPDDHYFGWKTSSKMKALRGTYINCVVPFRMNYINASVQSLQAMCLVAQLSYKSGSAWINIEHHDMYDLVKGLTTHQRQLLLDSNIVDVLQPYKHAPQE